MNIMDFLGKAQDAREGIRFQLADALGKTNTMVDEGDASEYKVIDQDAFNDTQNAFMKAASSMAKMPEIKPGVIAPAQVISSPAPMSGQSPNPYQPVNYGTMSYQPQGGIGSAPTMEQILKALASRSV